MTNDVDYRFNIINCEKANSQLNFGKPFDHFEFLCDHGSECFIHSLQLCSICLRIDFVGQMRILSTIGSVKSIFLFKACNQ